MNSDIFGLERSSSQYLARHEGDERYRAVSKAKLKQPGLLGWLKKNPAKEAAKRGADAFHQLLIKKYGSASTKLAEEKHGARERTWLNWLGLSRHASLITTRQASKIVSSARKAKFGNTTFGRQFGVGMIHKRVQAHLDDNTDTAKALLEKGITVDQLEGVIMEKIIQREDQRVEENYYFRAEPNARLEWQRMSEEERLDTCGREVDGIIKSFCMIKNIPIPKKLHTKIRIRDKDSFWKHHIEYRKRDDRARAKRRSEDIATWHMFALYDLAKEKNLEPLETLLENNDSYATLKQEIKNMIDLENQIDSDLEVFEVSKVLKYLGRLRAISDSLKDMLGENVIIRGGRKVDNPKRTYPNSQKITLYDEINRIESKIFDRARLHGAANIRNRVINPGMTSNFNRHNAYFFKRSDDKRSDDEWPDDKWLEDDKLKNFSVDDTLEKDDIVSFNGKWGVVEEVGKVSVKVRLDNDEVHTLPVKGFSEYNLIRNIFVQSAQLYHENHEKPARLWGPKVKKKLLKLKRAIASVLDGIKEPPVITLPATRSGKGSLAALRKEQKEFQTISRKQNKPSPTSKLTHSLSPWVRLDPTKASEVRKKIEALNTSKRNKYLPAIEQKPLEDGIPRTDTESFDHNAFRALKELEAAVDLSLAQIPG